MSILLKSYHQQKKKNLSSYFFGVGTFILANKHFILIKLLVTCIIIVLGLVTQSCLTLCDPMDCSPPGPSPEPWEGTLASRRVEEGLSRSFPG